MAENDSSQEKTEQPTPRKLEKAREEGQLPRSRELNTMAVLLAGAAGFFFFQTTIGDGMARLFRGNFSVHRDEALDATFMLSALKASALDALLTFLPLLIMLWVVAILSSIGVGGLLLSGKALMPKFSRMNPLQGLKRMFSVKSLMELVKAVLKTVVVGGVAWLVLMQVLDDLLAISHEPLRPGVAHALSILAWSFLFLAASLILIALVDVPFQIYDHQKNLRMTKQEIKDEFKETEGKPEVKRRIRELQMDMAQRRMLQEVPKADVVITNPTHYSVALKYDPDSDGAPVLVAKGVDFMALKIREIAREHGVEQVEAPPLARSVYYHTEVDQEIPQGLYVAVAQILAYVFRLREFRKGRGERPQPVRDVPIPDDLRRD
ncbi:MAG: flagellar type III secretion system protein FlhB [Gammaproteobacteria bacterium]|nr:MAG: flagellar type III secretion system protein FlhB [Gammaproteobacteria bacterium]